MGKVVIEMSMSLDGYVAGRNITPAQGMGEDGDRIHAWVFDDPSGFERFRREQVERSGAVILGRRMYDNSIEAWDHKGPYGDDLPCFVVTHRPLVPADPIYTVVDDGIESALAKAQETAGSKDIMVGGADLDREFLAAGLVDELRIHVVDVVLRRRPAPVRGAAAPDRAGTDLRDRGRGRHTPHVSSPAGVAVAVGSNRPRRSP